MLEKIVVEKCCREVLRSGVKECFERVLWRRVLERSVGEECWRRLLEKSVVAKF